jgi:hypothetical protein
MKNTSVEVPEAEVSAWTAQGWRKTRPSFDTDTSTTTGEENTKEAGVDA